MSVPLVHPECESDSSEVSVLALSSVSSPGTELSSLGTKSVALSCAPWSSRIAPEGAQLIQLRKTPHLSPCAVGENEGFEAPLPSPISVKELKNANGVYLAREIPSRTSEMELMLESCWWNICRADLQRGDMDSLGLWPGLNRSRDYFIFQYPVNF